MFLSCESCLSMFLFYAFYVPPILQKRLILFLPKPVGVAHPTHGAVEE